MPQIVEITPSLTASAWEHPEPIDQAQDEHPPALLRGVGGKDAHKASNSKKKWKKFKSLASSLMFGESSHHAARHTGRTKAPGDPAVEARQSGPASTVEPATESTAIVRELALVPVSPASNNETPRSKPHLKGLRKKLHKYGHRAMDLWEEHIRAEQARKADKKEIKACIKTSKAEDKAIDATRKFLEQLDDVQKSLHGATAGVRDKLTPKIFSRRPADTACAELLDALQKYRAARSINRSTRPDRQARRILVAEAMKSLYGDARAAKPGTGEAAHLIRAADSGPRETARNMLTAIRLAAADKVTRDRLISTVQELQRRPNEDCIPTQIVNELLDDIVQLGLVHAAFHYQFAPLETLLELAAPRGADHGADAASFGKPKETVIAEQFDLVFRGYNEPGLVDPGETRIAYLERILKGFTHSLLPPPDAEPSADAGQLTEDERLARADADRKQQARRALQALAALFAIGDAERASALRKEILKNATSDALKLQYGNLFDRLSRLIARELHIDHNDQTFAGPVRSDRPAWADQQLWNEHERNRAVHPFHRPSRLRRFGKATWFWVKYLFSDGESCARKRVEYWEGNVDEQLRGVLKRLSRIRHYELDGGINVKTQKAIDKHMRRLHDAVDCLEVELREQGSERTANAYLERSLLQRYGELGGFHLHNISTAILEHGWQPQLQPRGAWSARMGYLRDRLHPFREPSDLKDVRAEHPDHATRLADTWRILRTTLRAEIMDQAFLCAIRKLVKGMRERNRDHVAEAAKRLAELDAQSPAETPMTPPEFQRALKQLSNDDLAVLEHKLTKYSWDKGRRMEDMLKPNELKRETLAEDNLFYLRALLERLHRVVAIVRQNRSCGSSRDERQDTDAPVQPADAAAIGSAGAPALAQSNPGGSIEAAPGPTGVATIAYLDGHGQRRAA